jgi:hypothetical protein
VREWRTALQKADKLAHADPCVKIYVSVVIDDDDADQGGGSAR